MMITYQAILECQSHCQNLADRIAIWSLHQNCQLETFTVMSSDWEQDPEYHSWQDPEYHSWHNTWRVTRQNISRNKITLLMSRKVQYQKIDDLWTYIAVALILSTTLSKLYSISNQMLPSWKIKATSCSQGFESCHNLKRFHLGCSTRQETHHLS